MLTQRLNDCISCTEIQSLLNDIDRKIFKLSKDMYNNLVFMLNKNISGEVMSDLLNYKRILIYRYHNSDYASDYLIELIATKVKKLIIGGIEDCYCEDNITYETTTTTTTVLTTTTTTTI